MSPEHDVIWLEPKADAYGAEGRLWCQDQVWDDGVKFLLATPEREVAADLVAAAQTVLNGLHTRIDRGNTETPYFEGIAALHAALAKARGEA